MGDVIQLTDVLGFERIPLDFRDGRKSVETPVYSLRIREVPRFLELDAKGIEGEAALVELYCREAEGFADTLTQSAYEQVLAKGEAMNRPFCDRARSRAAQRERVWVEAGRERMKLATELGLNLSPMPSQESAQPTT